MIAPLPPTLVKETLKALRGRRSQIILSEQMGYGFNQVYLLETGKRIAQWSDFEKICKLTQKSLAENLRRFFQYAEGEGVLPLLQFTLKSRKQKDVAKALEIPEARLSRWMRGKSEPPLMDAFRILHHVQTNFLEFLEAVVGEGKIESIQEAVKKRRSLMDTLYKLPFAGAVAPALQTKSYQNLKKHEPGFLAEHLGITFEEEVLALKALVEAGQVEIVNGKYELKNYSVNLSQDPDRFITICQYWSERAARTPKQRGQKSSFGYRVFGVTEEGRMRIRQAQIDYYNALTAIVKSEVPPYDHVIVINFQAFLPEEHKKPKSD